MSEWIANHTLVVLGLLTGCCLLADRFLFCGNVIRAFHARADKVDNNRLRILFDCYLRRSICWSKGKLVIYDADHPQSIFPLSNLHFTHMEPRLTRRLAYSITLPDEVLQSPEKHWVLEMRLRAWPSFYNPFYRLFTPVTLLHIPFSINGLSGSER